MYKFRRFKTPLCNHHSPKPGHIPDLLNVVPCFIPYCILACNTKVWWISTQILFGKEKHWLRSSFSTALILAINSLYVLLECLSNTLYLLRFIY